MMLQRKQQRFSRSNHHLLVLVSLCLLSCTSILLPQSSSVFVGAATTSSKYDQRERERRRKEREQRRRQQQQQSSSTGRRTSSKNNSHYSSHDQNQQQGEENPFGDLLNTFGVTLFSGHNQPKDILEGTVKAIQSLLIGGTVGIVSFIGIPIIGLYSQLRQDDGKPDEPSPILGLIAGGIVGGIAGTASTLAGVAHAAFQLGTGLWNTGSAVKAQVQGKRFDLRTRTWEFYSLQQEAEELNLKTAGNNNNKRRRSTSVKETEYYDILDVSPDASRGEIKRAYYKLAKVMHPDKNPDKEHAAELFLNLHQAYQTLSDDTKRADYDNYGRTEDGEATESPFDPSVFFAVVYDFQPVEPYIGELAVASFLDGIMKLSQSHDSQEAIQQFVWEHLWSNEADPRPRKRQVEIAQNILGRIEPYVTQEQAKDEFLQSAQEEAQKISAASQQDDDDVLGFTNQVLHRIGTVLKLEGGRYRAFHQRFGLGLPKGVYHLLNLKATKWGGRFHSWAKTAQLIRNTFSTGVIGYNDQDASIGFNKEFATQQEQDKAQEEVYKLLPDVMDMAGAFILQDISKAIHGACWRLFFDTSVDAATRLRRAEAVELLGREFLQQSKTSSEGKMSEEECLDKGARTEKAKDKIMRAFEISQMKAKGQDGFHED